MNSRDREFRCPKCSKLMLLTPDEIREHRFACPHCYLSGVIPEPEAPSLKVLRVARDGQELGAWPFDVVFALIRCGSLLPTDEFILPSMDDWEPLSSIIPPSPLHAKPAIFLGRDDEESGWVFYCRSGVTVIGPRPIDETILLIAVGGLSADDLLWIAGGERWISVADFLRFLEAEDPETASHIVRIFCAATDQKIESQPQQDESSSDDDWLHKGIQLFNLHPSLGGAYLGYKGVRKIIRWLEDDN